MKDPKGHGSNSRKGGSYSNIERSKFNPGQHVGYANGAWRITKSGGQYSATHNDTGQMLFSPSLGGMSAKLSDHAAASALQSSSPKSVAAPLHDAWSSTPGGDRADYPTSLKPGSPLKAKWDI